MKNIDFTFNYEVIRDFAGTAFGNVMESAVEPDMKLVWYSTALMTISDAINFYCTDYGLSSADRKIKNVYDLESRMRAIKTDLTNSINDQLRFKMIDALNNDTITYDLVEDVYNEVTKYNFHLTNIIYSILNTDKYLAIKESCNHKNSSISRQLLYNYYKSINITEHYIAVMYKNDTLAEYWEGVNAF